MQRDLKRLAAEPFDVLIVGGGVNGLATAWDASLRGLRVALVERGDFGGATSANSLKTIHGGLRYLQHLDFRRMRESIRERSTLMRIAPHLIRPVGFLVPAYGHGAKGRLALAAARRINDFLSRDRNRHLAAGLRIPDGEILKRTECLDRIPGLDPNGLTGGLIFYDGQMQSSERMTLAFALSAADEGAALANYAELVSWLREGTTVVGAVIRDGETAVEFDVRARFTINMTGPWSGRMTGLLDSGSGRPHGARLSKGIQIITRDLTGDLGLAITSRHKDSDAVLSRGARHYFIAPWRGHSLIGTTDTLFEGDPDAFRITESEVSAFVEDVAGAFPAAGLSRADVCHVFGGLQPIDPRRIHQGAQVAKSPTFIDHARADRIDGILTVIGVKYTGCRLLAEQTVDRACARLGHTGAPCRTHETPLHGGDAGTAADARERVAAAGILPAVVAYLAGTYGSESETLLRLLREDGRHAEPVPGADRIPAAAIVHAARHESAVRLSDVVMRRTDLGTLGHPGPEALRFCAEAMAGEMGWGGERRASEIADTDDTFTLCRRVDSGA